MTFFEKFGWSMTCDHVRVDSYLLTAVCASTLVFLTTEYHYMKIVYEIFPLYSIDHSKTSPILDLGLSFMEY